MILAPVEELLYRAHIGHGEDAGKEVARRHTGRGFRSFARVCTIRASASLT
jgi:hypothetical protein